MPPKPAKDQTKSTPTSKSANEKDLIKELLKKVTHLEKEKRTWEQKLKEKDVEIQRLKVVQGFCGEGDNFPTTPITNSRDLRSVPAANGTTGEGNIQDHSKEIKRLTEKNKRLKEDCDKLTRENEELNEKFNKPKDESKTMQHPGVKKDDTYLGSQLSLSELKKESGGQRLEIKEFEFKNQRQKDEINRLTKENEQQRNEIQKLHAVEETNTKLNEKIKKLEETKSQKENADRLYEAEMKYLDLKKQIKELQKIQSKEKEREEKLEEKDKENSKLSKTVNDLQTEIAQLKKANKKLEDKIKDAKELDKNSQLTGSKLTDNNPGIADLSDPNRPFNLGENFSELYDNQWTDAMEEMTCTVDEKQAIQILLRIVNDAYEFCVEKSDGYCEQIEAGITKLFNTKLSSLQKKLTKDYRKSMAVYLVSDLEEEFCKRSYKFDGESVKCYQKYCIRVCWFMAVQDPKVFIDVEDVSGKKFEDDKYKHFTKAGKVTDYLVWPVLYLHKGGPMLGKGVAQGK